jgi:hypothetical protein
MPKISALTSASTLDGTEVLAIVQSSTTVKATVDDIVNYVSAEPSFAKSTGYLTWDGADWEWKDETYAQVSQNNTWTKGQRGAFVALTSTSGSIAVDLDDSNNFKHTLTEDTELAEPTNAVAGQSGVIEFTNHASAPKTLALNAFWKFPGGAPSPVLTAANGAIDVLSYVVASSGTYAICSIGQDVS